MGKVAARRLKIVRVLEEQAALAERVRAESVAVERPLREWVSDFLNDKRIGSRSERTLQTYEDDLRRFEKAGGDATPVGVRKYLAALTARMKPVSAHRHYRSLRAFFGWRERNGGPANPLRGFDMQVKYQEKSAPPDSDVRALLNACDRSRWEGRRNYALVYLLLDSGLRISETCRLRWRDVLWSERKLLVHGKERDEFSPFGNTAAAALKMWRATQRPDSQDGFVFSHRDGRPMLPTWGTHLLHKLSRKAGVPLIGPQALRRFMATSLLRETGDIELTRKAGRWRSYEMVKRYAKISGGDVVRKFVANSPGDRLRAGR